MNKKQTDKAAPREELRGDLRQVTIHLPEEIHRALRHESIDRGLSMSKIIIEALQGRVVFHDH